MRTDILSYENRPAHSTPGAQKLNRNKGQAESRSFLETRRFFYNVSSCPKYPESGALVTGPHATQEDCLSKSLNSIRRRPGRNSEKAVG
jgi:hypothetical protein